MNYYLVAGMKRSGTTLVHLLLMGHPNVCALKDELKVQPFFSKGVSTFTFGDDFAEEKAISFQKIYEAITSLRSCEKTLSCGAKIAIGSKKEAAIVVDTVTKHMSDMKIILLRREDLIAQYGSLIKARRSGIMHSWYEGFKSRKNEAIPINKWLFARYALACFEINKILENISKSNKFMGFAYEDYLASPESMQERLFDFIDVPMKPVTWLKSKKVLPPPENYIRNYNQLKNFYSKIKADYDADKLSKSTILTAKIYHRLYYGLTLRVKNKKQRWIRPGS